MPRLHRPALTTLLLLTTASLCHAAIRPSFSLEESAWPAPTIVVASQAKNPGDPLTILEVWKGDLKPGAKIQVTDLPAAPIEISSSFGRKPDPKSVTGNRIILFLAPDPNPDLAQSEIPAFKGTNPRGGTQVSTVWIEQDHAYAFQQIMNPGPTELEPLEQTDAQFKKQTLDLLAAKDALHTAIAITNLRQRARALAPMAAGTFWYQRKDAFTALGDCGIDAIPFLNPMLHDPRFDQSHLVQAIAAASGEHASEQLITILRDELLYWRKTAPTLKPGWWNAEPAATRTTLQNRYDVMYTALNLLAAKSDPKARDVVTELRDFWPTVPPLTETSGPPQLNNECNAVLKLIPNPPSTP